MKITPVKYGGVEHRLLRKGDVLQVAEHSTVTLSVADVRDPDHISYTLGNKKPSKFIHMDFVMGWILIESGPRSLREIFQSKLNEIY